MQLQLKGYSTREIGTYLGAPDNYVTAWEAKARKYLRALKSEKYARGHIET